MRKLTQKEAEKQLNIRLIEENCIWNPEYKSGFQYVNARQNIYLQCTICKNTFSTAYCNFVSPSAKSGCKICKYKKSSEIQKLPEELSKERLNIRLSEENCIWNPEDKNGFKYINAHQKLNLLCKTCNNKFTPIYNNFVTKNRGCGICHINSTKLNIQEVTTRLDKRLLEENCQLLTEFIYIDGNSRLDLQCKICKTKFTPIFSSFATKETGCKICKDNNTGKNQTLSHEEALIRITKRLEEENSRFQDNYIFNYNGTKNTRLKLTCNKCFSDYTPLYRSFVIGSKSGCSRCNKSKLEKQIKGFLDSNNIKYIQEYSPIFLNKKRLDFYLLELKIAIETQGSQHFEGSEYYGGDDSFNYIINNDIDKFNECTSNGIKLIYFANKDYSDNDEYHQPSHRYYNNIFTSEKNLLSVIKSYH